MIRLIPFYVEILIFPLLAYALWLLFKHKKNPLIWYNWKGAPWLYIFGGSAVVLVLTFMISTQYYAQDGQKNYAPAHIENGKLVPSQVK